MKKKFFIILSVLICALCCAFVFTACVDKGTPEVTVTLKANGGAFSDGTTSYVINLDSGASVKGLVPYPKYEGYVFEGWSDSETSVNIVDLESSAVTVSKVLYAVWAEKVSVTFNANGGQFEGGDSTVVSEIKKGGNASALTDISRENYNFGGWYKGQISEGKITLSESFDFSQSIDEDITIYAKWTLHTGIRLSSPSNIEVSTGGITWDEVDGANGYRIVITNSEGNTISNYTTYDTYSNENFYYYGEDDYTVKVRSEGDGINYINSTYASKNYAFKLRGVNISYDYSASELTWEESSDLYPSAQSYALYIYDAEEYNSLSEPIYSNEETTSLGFDMSAFQAGEYIVRVVSSLDGFTPASVSQTIFKSRLATPDVVLTAADSEDNGDFSSVELQWKEVKYATHYIVTVGSYSDVTTSLSYTVTKAMLDYVPGPGDPVIDPSINVGSSVDFEAEAGTIEVRAFSDSRDYFVSLLPTTLASSKASLAEISVSSEQGSVTASGNIYKYNEAPFSVRVDYLSNLYVYDTARALKDYFSLYRGRNSTIVSSSSNRVPPSSMFRTHTVTDSEGLELPEYFRLCFVPKDNYVINYTYIQCGWYADSECTVPFDFSVPITRDITIYAGWLEINEKLKVEDIYKNDFSQSGVYLTARSYSADTESDVNVYFTIRAAMDYTVDYSNDISGSRYANSITIYNVTKGRNIAVLNATSDSAGRYEFRAEAGDLLRVTFRHTGDEASTLSWEIYRDTLRDLPSGGKAGENNYSSANTSFDSKVYALKGSVVTLSVKEADGYTFLGWYDAQGNKVSDEYSYTFVAGADTAYTAKWE